MRIDKNLFEDAIFIVFLIIINLLFLYPIFQGQFTRFPLSIESVFLAEAKFIFQNFPHITWYPFWYFGLPFALVYQPITIFLTAFFSFVTKFDVSQTYRILTGGFLILGSLSLYLWVKNITKNHLSALVSGLAFTILPSIAYLFLSPSWQGYGLIPLRLVNAIVYGEGPHMWGLALIPFACLFFQQLLRESDKKRYWLGTILVTGIILLTSLTAFVGLLVFLFFIFWLEAVQKNFTKKLQISFLILIFTFGFCLFWYNPQFIKAISDYSQGDGGGTFTGFWSNIVFSAVMLSLFFACLYGAYRYLAKRLKQKSFAIVLPLSIFVFLTILIYGWFTWNAAIFPLPFRTIPRLIPELELAFALLLGLIFNLTPKKLNYLAGVALLVVIVFIGWNQRAKFWYLFTPHTNFSQTSEYVITNELNRLGAKRIYATGTNAFWLNLFSESQQLRGGKGGDFGGLNPWWAHLTYFINKSDDSQMTEMWLRSLGIEYIVVNYPDSKVYYHDYDHLERFEDWQEVFAYQGDKIFKVPTQNTSLAIALPKGWSDIIKIPASLAKGEIVTDKSRLEKYFAAVENQARPLVVEYPYQGNWSRLKISAAQVGPGEEILIRQTYFPGWQAQSNGQKVNLNVDPIGFIIIANPPEQDLFLQYNPDISMILSSLLSLVTLIVFIIFLRKSKQTQTNMTRAGSTPL